jgi:hypothetical protein
VDAFFLSDFIFIEAFHYYSFTNDSTIYPFDVNGTSTDGNKKKKRHYFYFFLNLLMLFPCELIGQAISGKYLLWLRVFRLLRMVYFNEYWNDFWRVYFSNIRNSGIKRALYFLTIMIIVAHIGACSFYAIGVLSLKLDNNLSWLVYDDLVILNQFGGIEYLERDIRMRYLRSLYWAIQTLVLNYYFYFIFMVFLFY